MGTPTHAFDKQGNKVWERELDIYGAIRKEIGIKGLVPQLYQGQWMDAETGLAYNRFRYYDCSSGIYLSQDPIGLQGGTALYGYVHDPNTWVDVFGLSGAGTGTPFQVGLHEDLIKINGGTGLDSHHAGQKAIMDKLVVGYDKMKAPAILVPSVGHTRIKDGVGIVSRSPINPTTGKPFDSARDLLARDIKELRRVYGDAVSNKQLQELIDLNKSMYPEMNKPKAGCH